MGKTYSHNLRTPVSRFSVSLLLQTSNSYRILLHPTIFYTYHSFLTDLLLLYFVPQSFTVYGIESIFLNLYSTNKYTPFASSILVYFYYPFSTIFSLQNLIETSTLFCYPSNKHTA